MKKLSVIIILIFFGFFTLPAADLSVPEEHVSYSILAFNGRDYSYSFTIEDTEILYFIEGQDNFLSLSKSLFYFWPITNEWKVDNEHLNYSYMGFLEILKKGELIDQIDVSKYVLFAIDEEYEVKWYIEKGDAAKDIYSEYKAEMDRYWNETTVYNKKVLELTDYRDTLIKKIEEMNKNGRGTVNLIDQLNGIVFPKQPLPPDKYISPPHDILEGYLVNLPAGEYDIRFKTEDGFIVEGSEKKVVIYKKNTETSVGYEIIPENKWTRSVVSDRPESVIYLDGSTDLYLQCFYQDQYNDFFHSKTLNVTDKGNPESMKWFRVMQIENAGIELKYENGSYTTINAEPFIVEQKEGSSLGYSILPYKSREVESHVEPSLIAFHLPLDKDVKKIQFHAVDENGNIIRNSYRQVRVLSAYRGGIISLVLIILPMLLYVLIIIRYRYFRK